MVNSVHQPIFIIGSYRSGTSVLTWCLGQHPNILQLPETYWIAKLAAYLHDLYKMGTATGRFSHIGALGWSDDDFYREFGEKVDQFIVDTKQARLDQIRKVAEEKWRQSRGAGAPAQANTRVSPAPGVVSAKHYQICRSDGDPKARWVDGTPENTYYVYGLAKMFPRARFIHILREPIDVARSLSNFHKVGGGRYSERQGFKNWTRLVGRAVEAENALGGERVVRVHYEGLVARPEDTMRQLMAFLGEEYTPDCLLPLNQQINSSKVAREEDPSVGQSKAGRRARDYYERVMAEYIVDRAPDDSQLKLMAERFTSYAEALRH